MPTQKERKKIILFYPKISETEILKTVPLSLLSPVRTIADKYDIKIFSEVEGDDYIEKTLAEFDEKTICFGVSCMTGWQVHDGVKVSKLVKKLRPEVPIVWGGWHPSLLIEGTLEEHFVDIIVWGMGETTFPDLVKALEKNIPLNKVKGIYYKENNEIKKTEPRPFEKLDDMPHLPYHLINNIEKYIIKEEGYRTINYYSSYGCPYACTFCATCGIYNRMWNGLSAEKTLDEMENLIRKYNINKIIINDNNFFVNENRVFEICKGILDRNLKVELCHVSGRARTLANYKEETWKLMSKCITPILIGAESPSKKTLRMINKECDVKHTYKFARLCKKYRIRAVYSLMVGFPFLNIRKKLRKEFSEMIRFIRNLMKIDSKSRFMLFVYTPYPGNPLFEYSKKKGYKEPKKLVEWSRVSLNRKNTPWMPEEYVFLTEMITEYSSSMILSFDKVMKGKRFNFITKFIYLIAYGITKLRWETGFFRFPIDYVLFKKIMKPRLVAYAKNKQRKQNA